MNHATVADIADKPLFVPGELAVDKGRREKNQISILVGADVFLFFLDYGLNGNT